MTPQPVRRLFFRTLTRLHVSDRVYYWLLDRLDDNNGWRPLHMRYPEHFPSTLSRKAADRVAIADSVSRHPAGKGRA